MRKQEDRTRGLQFRTSLGEKNGMLFVFPSSRTHSFWMKDTLIPLDIIWIDYARRAVHIERDVPPCEKDPCPTYTPSGKAMYVLELNAGKAEAIGLRSGDRMDFRMGKEF